DDCNSIVNLCSSLESISNKLYPEDICEICDAKKVMKGLKDFLATNAFIKNNLYPSDIQPMEELIFLYNIRSKIVHGSLKTSELRILKNYIPKAIIFVGITLYILILNSYITKFDTKVIQKSK
ncbi:MAG: hypothetical protein ABJG28_09625, partial [Nonlabens ulvanivorans]|uniref:hypothetical protein n=1 Tax=Nonlabens ulvanivorans TaxID=906888 RepID=UPI0032668340